VQVEVLSSAGPGGAQIVFATTDSNGRYSAALPFNVNPPYVVRFRPPAQNADPAFPRLLSITTRPGTVNVTPLTDLLVSRLLGRKLTFDGDVIGMVNMPAPTDQQVATATQQVTTYLASRNVPVNASAVTDFVSTPFNPVPGNAYDDALTALRQSMQPTENLLGVEEHLLFGTDIQTNFSSLFPLSFTANCSTSDAGLPSGSTPISFQQNSITIGSYLYTFQQPTGDAITIQTSTTLEESWTFFLNGTGGPIADQVTVNRAANGNLAFVVLNRAGNAFSSCIPSSTVSLVGKWPSIVAQVSRLANTLTTNGINCAPAAFDGIPDGANTLSILNGMLLASPGTYRLHLFSASRVVVQADTAVVVGAFDTRMRSFAVEQTFGDQFDTFSISLTPAGAITSASFSRRRNGVTQSKNC
jgi:hypothetical protein